MTTDFNLTTEPWIPVTWRGSARGKARIGLRETFERGHEIFDLSCRPHERVALLRLLQCVVQAAFSNSSDPHQPSLASFKKWRALAANEYQPMRDAAVRYLGQHHPEFWLFDPKRPFLQLAGLQPAPKAKKQKRKKIEEPSDEDGDEVNAEKRADLLDICFARNNTSTLFDQSGGSQSDGTFRELDPGRLALALLCYLNFASGIEGVALLNGKVARSAGGEPAKERCYTSDAPCVSGGALHTFALGQCLAETIHLNLVLVREMARFGFGNARLGLPAWEMTTDWLQQQNAAADLEINDELRPGLLEWLVPMSRFSRLVDCRLVVLTNGVGYSSFLPGPDGKGRQIGARLPSTALQQVKIKGMPQDVFLGGESGKALWRQLHLAAFLSQTEAVRLPVWRTNVDDLKSQPGEMENSARRVRLLAVAALTKKAKFEEFVESVFEFRAGLLWLSTTFNDYAAGLKYAEHLEDRITKAVAAYIAALAKLGKDFARDLKRAATRAFWTSLDMQSACLLALLDQGKNDFAAADNPWGQVVRDGARMAFTQTCPSLNPQQILAHAAGLAVLFPLP
ncbi:MAG: type I-E CRISPR-associated protein Cse1/CasA [Verrucomicrobia bacterium]|nr:type I-E CRISPR-associated protein Cse1/CasA [Verrucomicrobiota bacterium]